MMDEIKTEITNRLMSTHPTEHPYLVQRDSSFVELIPENKEQSKEIKSYISSEIKRINDIYTDAGIRIKIQSANGIDFPDMGDGKNAKPLPTEVNVYHALKEYGKFEFRYDAFTETYSVREKGLKHKEWRGLTLPEVRASILMHLSKLSPHMRVSDATMLTVARSLCEEHMVDSGLAEFKKEVWDGKERLSTWLGKITGINDDFTNACGEQWLQALAMRQYQPGFKFDYMLVISGPQGTRKTTMFEVIGGQYYKQVIGKPEGNNWFAKVKGSFVIDMDEGRALTLTDVNYMKGLISARKDIERAMYSQDDRERQRRFVMGMTTNATQFLRDTTGNRRYLVIFINEVIDTDWLLENRQQLFAEAYHRCVNGIKPKEINISEAEAKQNEAFEADEITSEIEKYLMRDMKFRNGDMGYYVTIYDVYKAVYYGDVTPDMSKYTRKIQREISEALKAIGLELGKRKKIGGSTVTPWCMTQKLSDKLSVKDSGVVEWSQELPEGATMKTEVTQETFDAF